MYAVVVDLLGGRLEGIVADALVDSAIGVLVGGHRGIMVSACVHAVVNALARMVANVLVVSVWSVFRSGLCNLRSCRWKSR